MDYEIINSDYFEKWLKKLDTTNIHRVLSRLYRLKKGHFGDHKHLTNNLFELRLFFGSGYRIYYTIKNKQTIILLCGGNKDTQSDNIKKANTILQRR